MKDSMRAVSQTQLLILGAVFLVSTGNLTFFGKLTEIYPWSMANAGFLLSAVIVLGCVLLLLMALASLLLPARLVLSLFILLAAVSGYFSDQFGTVIDTVMIQNALETNAAEAADLINSHFLLRLVVLGIVPLIVLWSLPLRSASRLRELRYRGQTVLGSLALMLICLFAFSDQYASFFREHKPVRYYTNPTYPIYSMGKYLAAKQAAPVSTELVQVAPGAARPVGDADRELIIMVVGETARRDHFSLNGYARNTNPELAQISNLVSYQQVAACGTSTAISVPCMFALNGHDDFDNETAQYTENVLDILQRAGVSVLWRDNNSDSKGVATRVHFEDFRSPAVNPVCDIECRDIGMLQGLQGYIDDQAGDILIVLHQMGNHGPAYYKRYPPEFERFTPACHSAELSACSEQEINNAYDNAILYTDYFLSQVIALLKANTPQFETAMLYVSDHGESLGEKGLYLHGMPYLFAPKEQTEVPVIVWVGESSDVDFSSVLRARDEQNSHDAVSYSLLAAFEIEDALASTQLFFDVLEHDKQL